MVQKVDNMELRVRDLNNQVYVFHIPKSARRKVESHHIEYSWKKADGGRHRLVLSLFGLPYIEVDE